MMTRSLPPVGSSAPIGRGKGINPRSPRTGRGFLLSLVDWADCPMAIAFNIHDPDEAPPLYRRAVMDFVQRFDAGLVPKPEIPEAVAS